MQQGVVRPFECSLHPSRPRALVLSPMVRAPPSQPRERSSPSSSVGPDASGGGEHAVGDDARPRRSALRRYWQTPKACLHCKACPAGIGVKKHCSRCVKAFYCSEECQRGDWPRHKVECKQTSSVTDAERACSLLALLDRDVLLDGMICGAARAIMRANDREGTWAPGSRRFLVVHIANDSNRASGYAVVLYAGVESPETVVSLPRIDPRMRADGAVARVTFVSEMKIETIRRMLDGDMAGFVDPSESGGRRTAAYGAWLLRDAVERQCANDACVWPVLMRALGGPSAGCSDVSIAEGRTGVLLLRNGKDMSVLVQVADLPPPAETAFAEAMAAVATVAIRDERHDAPRDDPCDRGSRPPDTAPRPPV